MASERQSSEGGTSASDFSHSQPALPEQEGRLFSTPFLCRGLKMDLFSPAIGDGDDLPYF
ncbi:uncharacterized protein PADG_12477 [Paracoccidioides brasiliensis Pb18]|uniref:Uncharacterized protein n=1 Tax=Paracoccidioides brasiliensis (strain Pb18) TaxID=502780 RepID=A0A0A0HTX0_PARBD|nr:uncharacterized protein PADG_12477 [Paracoccidioides brasiliensis Pb18]KGM91456.1 hypothetical protein PADG_12477 [Paracoccidioides brasiliensis Pb18]